MEDFALPTAGHNNPPSAIEMLLEEMEEAARQLVKRRDELLAGADRVPQKIENEDVAGKVGDLIKLLNVCAQTAEKSRKASKEPHLEAGRAVDAFFAKLIDPLAAAKTTLQGRLNEFMTRKAAEARRKAEEEASRAQAEADRLAADALAREAAAKPSAPAAPILEQAVAAEARAQAAAVVATAKPADLSRSRGDYGSVASLRTTWEYEIADANAIPRQFLTPNDTAIRAHIKARAKDQAPAPIAGIRFFEKSTTVVR